MANFTGVTGRFYGLSTATLNTLLTQYTDCLSAIAVAGQSYTIAGRQFNRAQIEDVANIIADIQDAITRAAGTRVTKTYSRFTPP